MELNVYIDSVEFDEFIVCFNGVEKLCSMRKRKLKFNFDTKGIYQLEIRSSEKKKIFAIDKIREKVTMVLGGYRHYKWEEAISAYNLSLKIELDLEEDQQVNLKYINTSCDKEGYFLKPVFEILEADCIKNIEHNYEENPSYLQDRFKMFFRFINSGIIFLELFIALCAVGPLKNKDYAAGVMILILLLIVIMRHVFIFKKESKKYKELQQILGSMKE